MREKYTRRWTALLCGICLVFSLTACAGQSGNETEEILSQTSDLPPEEIIQPAAEDTLGETNILIAYFTWADNTEVEDVNAAIDAALSHYDSIGDRGNYDGVEAVSSASVIAPGNTVRIAEWIQERTGGDLFSIVVSEPYSSDYDECLDRSANEKATDARPELASHVENMENYEIVFLGASDIIRTS